jgi:hypothetical protein
MYSQKPLTLTEMADAIAFDFSDQAHHIYKPRRRDDNTKKILEWLEGLVTITINQNYWTSSTWKPEQQLSLAHSSVKDYILSPHFTAKFGYNLSSGPSHTFIARSCICYLLHFADNPLKLSTFPSYPFALYAAENWYHRPLQCQDTVLFTDAMHLLENGTEQYTAFSGLSAEALASFCELPSSCGYASAMSGYMVSQGRLATSPLASASRWLGGLARAWVAGPWARHIKSCVQSLNSCCYGNAVCRSNSASICKQFCLPRHDTRPVALNRRLLSHVYNN